MAERNHNLRILFIGIFLTGTGSLSFLSWFAMGSAGIIIALCLMPVGLAMIISYLTGRNKKPPASE